MNIKPEIVGGKYEPSFVSVDYASGQGHTVATTWERKGPFVMFCATFTIEAIAQPIDVVARETQKELPAP